jgi:hypothetical protein
MASAENQTGWLKAIYTSLIAGRRIDEGVVGLLVTESGVRIPHVQGPLEFPLRVTGWVRYGGSADDSEE